MPNTMTLISSVTVGAGGASSIDFTNIPQTYTDLRFLVSSSFRCVVFWFDFYVRFNGSTTGYSDKFVYGYDTTTASEADASAIIVRTSTTSNTANTFGNELIYIPNYTSSSIYKSVNIDAVSENNGTALASLTTVLWSNNSAITQITLTPTNAQPFVQYTTSYLYGIKNS